MRFVFLAVIVISLTLSVVYSFVGIVFSQGKYCGSIKSDVYHYPWCHYVAQIKPENLIWFVDEYDAVSKGYRPCKVCNPPYPGQQTVTQTTTHTFASTPTTISAPTPTPTLTYSTSTAFPTLTSTEVVSSSMTTASSITSATVTQTVASDQTLTSFSTPMSTFTQATSTTTQPPLTVTSVLVVTSVTAVAVEEPTSTILTSLLLILVGGTGSLAYIFWRKRKAE